MHAYGSHTSTDSIVTDRQTDRQREVPAVEVTTLDDLAKRAFTKRTYNLIYTSQQHTAPVDTTMMTH